MKAQKLQKRAADVGFDWPDLSGAVEKLHEELKELLEACDTGCRRKIEEETGDLFFALVNIARFLGVEAEIALQSTVDKFIRRFRYIEDQVQLRGGNYSAFSLEELDRWWEEAKEQETRGARAQEPCPGSTPPEKRTT
jgi:tetrapyrrole methylase family protein/MazG family protein